MYNAPANSFDMLLELIQENFDYPYEDYLRQGGRTLNPRNEEKIAIALRNYWTPQYLPTAKQEKTLSSMVVDTLTTK
ncbi:MAG: hypothetical protein ACRDEA_16685 [Microcystaceae cyanobacterium]